MASKGKYIKKIKFNTSNVQTLIYLYLFFCPMQEKTPKGKGDKSPKTPPTPKGPLSVPEIKAKMMEAVKKVCSWMSFESVWHD